MKVIDYPESTGIPRRCSRQISSLPQVLRGDRDQDRRQRCGRVRWNFRTMPPMPGNVEMDGVDILQVYKVFRCNYW